MEALREWIDIVQTDICRIFDRFTLWSIFSIPFKLAFMCLKWGMLALLVPLKALTYNQP
ncbi:MAG: hypothetical protein K2L77_03230 [Muribaculaceae bacterium]|nr:hypothetical protein [Muribaculaceae bacterium]